MNRGLIIKSIREVWLSTLLLGLGVAVFEALLAYIVPTFYEDLTGQLANLKVAQRFFEGLVGEEMAGVIGPKAMLSIAWVHPIMLALVWAHGVINCTRLPADEVERGTIGVLLAVPISRAGIYCCDSAVWGVAGGVVVMMGLAGSMIGARFVAPELRSDPRALLIIAVYLYCLYVSVAGVACTVSSLSDRRGRAVGAVFAIVLLSFLLNFLAQFWDPARSMAFLSVLHYYRPLIVMRDLSWPAADMLALAGVGVVFWVGGMIIFVRRDICEA